MNLARLHLGFTLLTLHFACTSVWGAVFQEHAEQPYTIAIAPGQSLREALNAATPVRHDGKRFHAFTAWNVTWNFWWRSNADGTCRITRVQTRLVSTMQLPRLEGGSPSQRAAFDRYEQALRQHEQGHVQQGRAAARAIDQAIADLPAASNCPSLEREANALGLRLLAVQVDSEKEYDRSTGYGATQGAKL